ncbi:hypothetical protein BD779DRAFT_1206748 [Infundibulicybe gibba]|nr:hypothetical protein BD779DRAFT_1206748 [Infundibulicybe gibba]
MHDPCRKTIITFMFPGDFTFRRFRPVISLPTDDPDSGVVIRVAGLALEKITVRTPQAHHRRRDMARGDSTTPLTCEGVSYCY